MNRFLLFFVGMIVCGVASSQPGVKQFSDNEFNPTLNQKFEFEVDFDEPVAFDLRIETEDRDVVRNLISNGTASKGSQSFKWDGKDDSGMVVPNEAYFPVLTYRSKGEVKVIDSRKTSGGEIVENLQARVDSPGQISFVLPVSSRVLARAGINGGAMMKSLEDWTPRPSGKNKIVWDAKDESGVDEFATHPDMAALVIAYQLPDNAIIASGNEMLNYSEYRRDKGWNFVRPERRTLMQKRGTRSLSPAFFDPKYLPVSPKVSLSVVESSLKLPDGEHYLIDKPVTIKVNVADDDKWALESSLFEVAFYIDYHFHTEEEQGYVPFTWRFNPEGLPAGRHVLTVNVSGYDGQVGAASLVFEKR